MVTVMAVVIGNGSNSNGRSHGSDDTGSKSDGSNHSSMVIILLMIILIVYYDYPALPR